MYCEKQIWRCVQFTQNQTRGHSTLPKIPTIHRLGLKPSLKQSFLEKKQTLLCYFPHNQVPHEWMSFKE